MDMKTTVQQRKKSWLCIFPGCKEPVKTHYNCYSHVWDAHLRHLAASPIYGGEKGQVYKKLTHRLEAKKQCELYMTEVNNYTDIEQQRSIARARIGNPQLSLLINSLDSEITNTVSNEVINTVINQNNLVTFPLQDLINSSLNKSLSLPSQSTLYQNSSNPLSFQEQSSPVIHTYECGSNEIEDNQLKSVLQHDDFIRIIQINENLKRLHVAGEILAENGFLQRSDARVKEHIEPLKGCLDKILKLTGKSFNYTGKEEKNLGFIAQEVQEVCPELVHEDEFGLSVDVIGIIPILVEALKEINNAASESNTGSMDCFKELSKAANDALENIKIISKKLQENEDEKRKVIGTFAIEEESFHFSIGPAIITFSLAVLLSTLSGLVIFILPKLPGVWFYCWGITCALWFSTFQNKNELKYTMQKRKLILYWNKENTLFTYVLLFIGLLTVGMSIVMGKSIIILCLVSLCILFILGTLAFWFNTKYKLSFNIIISVLVLFFLGVVVIIGVSFLIQPDYTCSINDNRSGYSLTINLNEKIPKQVISQLPWNCWSSSFEFSDKLPQGIYSVTKGSNTAPYIEGIVRTNFPTFTTNVYIKCVDVTRFYCGAITFKTCSSRTTEDDCIRNGCDWFSETGVCQ
ncbi:hypothetical protein CL6EHI_027790 [Entamoeba histolytica]|uniref:Peptidase S74 domain-containing protein n=3 Tax=Entamoeba histolytica TaxID=5759 RepID=C4M1W5_ENTH1|nr:hypothetical protein EHI_027790 [Entamoeba histolytica HM-1:IMSS]EAL52189.1 hypothetical protein EHI_027790 [Entamoeba histolytica HM-1:IMSS]ENY63148.1 hypothetical protein EHI7A_121440 [Entamoeba histolytica HM-1:IMSS-A]GAT95234.1 hypothetical protein CL6EHI_027790 [Entamoeba histolytica]|eukprot:XP_657564.1 hypothetical protein EHI_027790 [Entamoeba histolytica HM-1:IMSS]